MAVLCSSACVFDFSRERDDCGRWVSIVFGFFDGKEFHFGGLAAAAGFMSETEHSLHHIPHNHFQCVTVDSFISQVISPCSIAHDS